MSDRLQRVQAWISQPPQWLVIQAVDVLSGSELDNLDPGEQAAIVLAEQQGADLIVIDDLSWTTGGEVSSIQANWVAWHFG